MPSEKEVEEGHEAGEGIGDIHFVSVALHCVQDICFASTRPQKAPYGAFLFTPLPSSPCSSSAVQHAQHIPQHILPACLPTPSQYSKSWL